METTESVEYWGWWKQRDTNMYRRPVLRREGTVSYRSNSHPWLMVLPEDMWEEWVRDSDQVSDQEVPHHE